MVRGNYSEVTTTNHSSKSNSKKKFAFIGPGIILAATSIGGGDLITATSAGSDFGISLAWAALIGVMLKFFVTEGVGRWTLDTGQTIVEGWRSLGKWTIIYFFAYAILFGLIYGSAIATTSGYMMYTMFPVIPLWAWAVIHSIAGFILVLCSGYKIFQRIVTILVGIMFVTIVGSAIMLLPNYSVPQEALVPSISNGSISRTLSIIGGVGGTMAVAAYGYWVKNNGWKDKSSLPIMRLDSATTYIIIGIFAVSLMIISTQFLYGSGVEFSGDKGMTSFLGLYGDHFGLVAQKILNIGFWSAAFTSLIGSWNGIPYLFADAVRVSKKNHTKIKSTVSEKDPAYIAFLAWLTFPSMLLLLFNKPIGIVLLYSALGSLFLPFVAITLLLLLNSKKISLENKNKLHHNAMLIFVIVVFISLGVIKIM